MWVRGAAVKSGTQWEEGRQGAGDGGGGQEVEAGGGGRGQVVLAGDGGRVKKVTERIRMGKGDGGRVKKGDGRDKDG